MHSQHLHTISIAPLFLHPQHAATLARWHFAEWHHLYEGWSEAAACEELRQQTGAQVPTSLLALHGDEVIGSVSLVRDDLVGYKHLNPWLASLYVRDDWRGRGVGGRLVAAALEQARALGIARLYLFTPAQRAFYLNKGFSDFAEATAAGAAVTIMVCDP